MIRYDTSGFKLLLRLFHTTGSVFPASFLVALPCAGIGALFKKLTQTEETRAAFAFLGDKGSVLLDNSAWNGFGVLVGFLIIFRTSQAYARFWEGCATCHRMRVEWFNTCSQLVAFTATSKVDASEVQDFQVVLARLFSILFAVAIEEISEGLHDFSTASSQGERIGGIDPESLDTISRCDAKTELVYQWIQTLVVKKQEAGLLSAPPPMIAGALQRFSNGLNSFYDALKISTVPFPFPYAQTCECLLVMHWLIAPFIVCTWTTAPVWAAIFTFVQVFILWSLHFIAVEIENPFGVDDNDLDQKRMHADADRRLALLISAPSKRTPTLCTPQEELLQGVGAASVDMDNDGSTFRKAVDNLFRTRQDVKETKKVAAGFISSAAGARASKAWKRATLMANSFGASKSASMRSSSSDLAREIGTARITITTVPLVAGALPTKDEGVLDSFERSASQGSSASMFGFLAPIAEPRARPLQHGPGRPAGPSPASAAAARAATGETSSPGAARAAGGAGAAGALAARGLQAAPPPDGDSSPPWEDSLQPDVEILVDPAWRQLPPLKVSPSHAPREPA